jgi:TPR repeat protein
MGLSGRYLRWLLPVLLVLATATPLAAQDVDDLIERANEGNAAAQNNVGAMYHTGKDLRKDDAEAVRWWRRAAEQGNVYAQTNLGDVYHYGQGVAQNEAEAILWYQKAAEQGFAPAKAALERMYANGTPVRAQQQTGQICSTASADGRTLAEGSEIANIIKQAESGDAKAQSILGHEYDGAVGVANDETAAICWWRKAAAQGDKSAQDALIVMFQYGRGGVTEHEAEAAHWESDAVRGNAEAQYMLGNTYAKVDKNEAEAVRWYRKSAEQGYAAAQFVIAEAYDDGRGVAKDEVEAVRWYRKAAEQGDMRAQTNLGYAYANGEGIAKDGTEAVRWYRKAAENGYFMAQYNLGLAYHHGEGAAKDEAAALRWLCAAGDQGYNDAKVKYEELAPLYKVTLTRNLGIHAGQSQIVVKSILQRNGFKMPWGCTGSWQGATWYSTCSTYRGRSRQDFIDKISMNFSVHRRVRYTNSDTQVSNVVDEPADKLTDVNFFWGKND